MNRDEQKIAFAERLKHALVNKGFPISPTFIAQQFNLRYSGTAITVQSANNWLHGKALPNQDKLLLLSTWLQVSSQWLRFGEGGEHIESTHLSIDHEAAQMWQKFNRLPPAQQSIIRSLIDQFSQE